MELEKGQRDYSTIARAVCFNTKIEFIMTIQTPFPVVARHRSVLNFRREISEISSASYTQVSRRRLPSSVVIDEKEL